MKGLCLTNVMRGMASAGGLLARKGALLPIPLKGREGVGRGLRSLGTSGGARLNLSMWVDNIFNRVSYQRLSEVGPDRACCDWVFRLNGKVKIRGKSGWVVRESDLPPAIILNNAEGVGSVALKNVLSSKIEPEMPSGSRKGPERDPRAVETIVEGIDLSNSSATSVGLSYLKNMEHLQLLDFSNCPHFNNDAVKALVKNLSTFPGNQLVVDISKGCFDETALPLLASLSHLHELRLCNVHKLQDKSEALEQLQRVLPDTKVIWKSQGQSQ
eukprot:Nk52_evm3s269 gene=Nk52_evmTU3s269